MLEPLILLTVINCLLTCTFSLTNCALWWKYRNYYSCCKKKAEGEVQNPKVKPKRDSHEQKKAGKSEPDALFSIVSPDKPNATTGDDTKNRKCEKKRTKLKYLSQFSQRIDSRIILNCEMADNPEESVKKLANPTNPNYLVELCMVQKVVPIPEEEYTQEN